MEILNKIGIPEDEIKSVTSRLDELGATPEVISYFNEIGGKIEKASAGNGYSNAMKLIDEKVSSTFGVANTTGAKATEFLEIGLNSHNEKNAQIIADYEKKLADKGLNTEQIRSEVAENFTAQIEGLTAQVREYKSKIETFESEHIKGENKRMVGKYLLPLSDPTDVLAIRESDTFVNSILESNSEIIEINGEAYVKGENGVNVSIKELQLNDKYLSRFIKSADQNILGEQGRLVIKKQSQGTGYGQFMSLEGNDKVQAIEKHLKSNPSIANNPMKYKHEFARFMTGKESSK